MFFISYHIINSNRKGVLNWRIIKYLLRVIPADQKIASSINTYNVISLCNAELLLISIKN